MTAALGVELVTARTLRFDDGAPVRAASGVTRFEGSWLVVSDDAAHAALWSAAGVRRLRVLEPVEGHDLFDEASGTKALKPDLEAACRVEVGPSAALLLGSGSLRARMRAVLVEEGTRRRWVADLAGLYERVAGVLGVPGDRLNLEGACVVAGRMRWFQRGNGHLGIPSASVDLDLAALVAAVRSEGTGETVPVGQRRSYDLGTVGGWLLAVTDALALPDGRVLVSAAAEQTTNPVDDGPVVATALVLLDDERVVASARLPEGPAGPDKVEGLALEEVTDATARVVAVVDADDPALPSRALELAVLLP